MESTQTSDDKPAFSGRILGMNLDLMTLIAHQIPPRTDISRFMKACRAFHTIGAPALLSHGGSVYLSCKNELESFHAFMFPKFHTSTRRLFPYLRGLWLSLERLHQDAPSVKMLCDLLPNCTHLYSFEAEGMEELLAIVPTLFDTLRVQPNLTELYMHASEERATELLAVIRTPLRKLELGRDHPQDPVYFSEFKRFASTLTALTMFSGELDFDDLPSNLVFPLLRDLEIRVKTTVPSARIFRTFPNIKKLELRETSVPEDDEWDELHDESMEELEAYDGPRPSLDVVQGDSILLDSCALYCPIKTFLVDVMALDRVDHIANLVQTCHISTLHVGLEGLKECNEELARLGFKLSRIPVQTLKALRVDVQLDPKDVNVLREVAVSHESPFPSSSCFLRIIGSCISSM
ncbi:hypothetical protein NLI96_g2863 [Meripilus lineatus]|uniref:Uncharacterized protein n=1 Tax=Meripilus lineatus TaxID=2056292 RepID=A0AAD5VDE0_9APHY|nr:hypothetical protein NLI96_g2863 [Physisporinus lineatus]